MEPAAKTFVCSEYAVGESTRHSERKRERERESERERERERPKGCEEEGQRGQGKASGVELAILRLVTHIKHTKTPTTSNPYTLLATIAAVATRQQPRKVTEARRNSGQTAGHPPETVKLVPAQYHHVPRVLPRFTVFSSGDSPGGGQQEEHRR